jgi:putative acetyltransferase
MLMHIERDDLTRKEVQDLLREHLANMHELSPPESVHALDLDGLRAPDVTFWTVWDNGTLIGCGALKELSATQGEIKSMRTPANHRRQGAGRAVLAHIIDVARRRGYERLSLETGPVELFTAAHHLYLAFGFEYCGPFANYREDPFSAFMTLRL